MKLCGWQWGWHGELLEWCTWLQQLLLILLCRPRCIPEVFPWKRCAVGMVSDLLFFLTAGSQGGDLGNFLDLFVMFFQISTKQLRSKGLISICKFFCRCYQLILQIMMPFFGCIAWKPFLIVTGQVFTSSVQWERLISCPLRVLIILSSALSRPCSFWTMNLASINCAQRVRWPWVEHCRCNACMNPLVYQIYPLHASLPHLFEVVSMQHNQWDIHTLRVWQVFPCLNEYTRRNSQGCWWFWCP